MPGNHQIIYAISRDPDMGECIVPRVAERSEEGPLRLHRTKVALKHVANLDLQLDDTDHVILKILEELTPERSALLRKVVRPFMLRRTKEAVAPDQSESRRHH